MRDEIWEGEEERGKKEGKREKRERCERERENCVLLLNIKAVCRKIERKQKRK